MKNSVSRCSLNFKKLYDSKVFSSQNTNLLENHQRLIRHYKRWCDAYNKSKKKSDDPSFEKYYYYMNLNTKAKRDQFGFVIFTINWSEKIWLSDTSHERTEKGSSQVALSLLQKIKNIDPISNKSSGSSLNKKMQR